MKPIKLKVKTDTHSYPIIIGQNLCSKISSILNENSLLFKKCMLVIDKNVPKKIVSRIKKNLKNKKVFTHYINANEKNKSQKTVDKIIQVLLNKNFSRQDCLFTIGGGITGDIGGFAASLFKRGLKFVNVPTTLLSQVDSSIGGKTGVNTVYGKNLIGSFYQPRLVISDINFLKTLNKREIVCGYGEILKHSLIANKIFYNFLKNNFNNIINIKSPFIEKAIYESCKIKRLVVEKDEKEKGLRKILNFGHTFAHAYEAALGFSKKLNHGEAVILGMSTAIRFSHKEKILNGKELKSIENNMLNSNLPNNINNFFEKKDINKILSFMIKDKKNDSDKINLILLKKIGHPIIDKKYSKNSLKSFLSKELTN